MYSKLKYLIQNKKAKLAVIGLGYVGLPIVVEFARKGFFVYGLDSNAERVRRLMERKSYITDVSSRLIKDIFRAEKFLPAKEPWILTNTDVVIICVPTPLRRRKTPDMSFILKATRTVAKYLHPGQLIILESTTYPGTTRDVMMPILEKTGLREGRDFFLAFSPERIDPGNKRYPFSKIPKVVGGISKESAKLTEILYSKAVDRVIPVSSAEAAEMVKLLENTFRTVNIGLINEFAMLCHKLNINIWEVVDAAKSKPFGFMPFYPGPGIGGHCIGIDPLYLSWKARKVGFKTNMINLASKTNTNMPHYVVSRAEEILKKNNKDMPKAKVLILGVAYKKDVKDLRESPALDVIEQLQLKGCNASYADPYIPYLDIEHIKLVCTKLTGPNIKKQDLVILTTDHSGFNYRMISRNAKCILDTRNAFGLRGIKKEKIIKL